MWRWLLLLLPLVAAAECPEPQEGEALIRWQAPTKNTDGTPLTDLSGYTIYWGDESGAYTESLPVSDSEATCALIPITGPVYVAATAWDTAFNESDLSNEILVESESTVWLPPGPPVDFSASWAEGSMAAATSYAEAEAGGFTIQNTGLGASVVAAFLPISDSVWKDVVNDVTGSLDNGATISSDATSRYTQFDGVNDIIDFGTGYRSLVPSGNAEDRSMVAYGLFDGTASHVAGMREGTDTVWQFAVKSYAAPNSVLYREGSTDENFTTVVADDTEMVGFSLDGSTDTVEAYLDGSSIGSLAANGTPSANDIRFYIGDHSGGGGYPTNALIRLVLVFDEALSDAEHASLASNPWQVFEAGLQPAVVDIAVITEAPSTASTAADVTASPGTLDLSVTTEAPTQQLQINPSAVDVELSLEAPTVNTDTQVAETLQPGVVDVELSLEAPTTESLAVAQPSTTDVLVTLEAPSITTETGEATATPSTVDLEITTGQPEVSVPATEQIFFYRARYVWRHEGGVYYPDRLVAYRRIQPWVHTPQSVAPSVFVPATADITVATEAPGRTTKSPANKVLYRARIRWWHEGLYHRQLHIARRSATLPFFPLGDRIAQPQAVELTIATEPPVTATPDVLAVSPTVGDVELRRLVPVLLEDGVNITGRQIAFMVASQRRRRHAARMASYQRLLDRDAPRIALTLFTKGTFRRTAQPGSADIDLVLGAPQLWLAPSTRTLTIETGTPVVTQQGEDEPVAADISVVTEAPDVTATKILISPQSAAIIAIEEDQPGLSGVESDISAGGAGDTEVDIITSAPSVYFQRWIRVDAATNGWQEEPEPTDDWVEVEHTSNEWENV